MTRLKHFESNKTLVGITKAVFKFCFAVPLLFSENLVKPVQVLDETSRGLSLAV